MLVKSYNKRDNLDKRIKVYMQSYNNDIKDYLRASFNLRSGKFADSCQNQYSDRPQLRINNQKLLKKMFAQLNEKDLGIICGTVVSHQLVFIDKEKIKEILQNQLEGNKKTKSTFKNLKKAYQLLEKQKKDKSKNIDQITNINLSKGAETTTYQERKQQQ